jgi:hypothetical protein
LLIVRQKVVTEVGWQGTKKLRLCEAYSRSQTANAIAQTNLGLSDTIPTIEAFATAPINANRTQGAEQLLCAFFFAQYV